VLVNGKDDLVNTVILTLAGAGVTANEVEVQSATLEDAFVKLTGRHLHEDEEGAPR
jgi:ABC-2 type transport system ATP-binding protein